jgi:hypothetical protein
MSYDEKATTPVESERLGGVPDLKHTHDDTEIVNEKAGSSVGTDSSVELGQEDNDGVRLVNGEPVIQNGKDVSRFLFTTRDDGDPAITLRSVVLGTVFAGLGAAMCQIYLFKPVQVTVSTVFLLLLIYSVGQAWAAFLPRSSWVKGTRFAWLGPTLHVINPGPFGLKEHTVAALVASTAAYGSSAVMNFAVQRLYYDTNVHALTAVLATFSTACFGYGLVGLLRPLTVYPSEMVYWANLPTVSIFQGMTRELLDRACA